MYRKTKERYSLTRPITSEGLANYCHYLLNMYNGKVYATKLIRGEMGQTMTFQALREKGLSINENGFAKITLKGKAYIDHYFDMTKGGLPKVKPGNFFKLYIPNKTQIIKSIVPSEQIHEIGVS